MGNYSGESLRIVEKSIFEGLSLEEIFIVSRRHGFGCAVYRLPNSDSTHFIIDLSSGRNLDHLHLEEMGGGFIFHPFSSEHHQIKFVNRDIHIVENRKSLKLELLHSELSTDELSGIFNDYKTIESNTSSGDNKKIFLQDSTAEQKSEFISILKDTIQEINSKGFQKAVMARFKNIDLPEQFSSFDFFSSLSKQYNNAFVYLADIPQAGSWIGATPETLINIDSNRQFKTIALAATQSYEEDKNLEDITWSQKDIEEQAMVSRYIINCFKKIRLREFEEIGPRTHISGNLVHLKTDYIVEMDQVGFPQLGTIMLELLHPTSAVCGMPKIPSLNYVLKNEGFDREYFSGFLGPVNILDETNLFVNLRCMKIMSQRARLFAGAGIISNSTPEKEWNETEIKMETLLKVLRELY